MKLDRPLEVVMPVHDGEQFLAEAIESVLRHSRVDRLVVVDDHSSDRSAEIARSYRRVVLLTGKGRGPAAARNSGLAVTTAPLVSFVDADDRWPDFSVTGDPRLARLEADPEIDIVLGRVRLFRTGAEGAEAFAEPLHLLQLGAAVCRRSVVDRVGLFDESLYGSEDFDWLARAREAGARLERIADVTLDYRRHEASIMADAGRRRALITEPVRAALLRRRAAKGEKSET
jgi:glycosyltransferase involved in cell wall biosynthesis